LKKKKKWGRVLPKNSGEVKISLSLGGGKKEDVKIWSQRGLAEAKERVSKKNYPTSVIKTSKKTSSPSRSPRKAIKKEGLCMMRSVETREGENNGNAIKGKFIIRNRTKPGAASG